MEGWIRSWMEGGGLPAIALLMALENVFPPIPSELIMPLAGYLSVRGDLSFPGIVIAGVVGSLAGALVLYGLGWWLGFDRLAAWADRHGHWVLVDRAELERAQRWFARHGGTAVLVARVVPGIRSLISIPAGVCGMPLPRFLALTSVGTSVWTLALGALGYWLGESFEQVGRYVGPVAWIAVAGLVAAYVVRGVRRMRSARTEGASPQ